MKVLFYWCRLLSGSIIILLSGSRKKKKIVCHPKPESFFLINFKNQTGWDFSRCLLINCPNFYLAWLVHSLETSQGGNEHIGGVEKLLTFNHGVVGTGNLKWLVHDYCMFEMDNGEATQKIKSILEPSYASKNTFSFICLHFVNGK